MNLKVFLNVIIAILVVFIVFNLIVPLLSKEGFVPAIVKQSTVNAYKAKHPNVTFASYNTLSENEKNTYRNVSIPQIPLPLGVVALIPK